MRWLEALLVRWPQADAATADLIRDLASQLEQVAVTVRVVNAPSGAGLPGLSSGNEVEQELARLEAAGIGPRLIGAVGDLSPLPDGVLQVAGGVEALQEVAGAQLALRRHHVVPRVELDPSWTLELPGNDPFLVRVEETLATLADTRFGTRGTLEEEGSGSDPLVVAAGRYRSGTGSDADATVTLFPGPLWTQLEVPAGTPTGPRMLDLASGLLFRETNDGLRTVRFVSLARPGRAVLRAEHNADRLAAPVDLVIPDGVDGRRASLDEGTSVALTAGDRGWMAAAARTEVRRAGCRTTVERHVVLRDGDGIRPDGDLIAALSRELKDASFEHLLRDQRRAWAKRWQRAAVCIDGDPELERAVRFALFHLIATVADHGEAPVGARGLSGQAYRGHVFWDADVFVLPFLAATHPPAARAMLTYRHARLDAARRAAADRGYAGARFPWESADDGTDVTPATAVGIDDKLIPIHTGRYQEHITADIAWAAAHYLDWTADRSGRSGVGRALLLETARYWASRATRGPDETAHILEVMGPDEYHGPVDDNAFTNGMVRFNLRRAAAMVDANDSALQQEAACWRQLADTLATGYDPATGRHEQFVGFDRLEPLLIQQIADPPVAADILLGRERTARTQVIKQADVVMLHHLLPGQLPDGSLTRDLDYYLPRTAHGSSLSPGIHAAVLARAGQVEDALGWLRLTAHLDLDDLTQTTAGGLHLAALGSVWQALAYGFLGLWPGDGHLQVDPRLPASWRSLEARVTFRGTPLRVKAFHERLVVSAGRPIMLEVSGHQHHLQAGTSSLIRTMTGWRQERPP